MQSQNSFRAPLARLAEQQGVACGQITPQFDHALANLVSTLHGGWPIVVAVAQLRTVLDRGEFYRDLLDMEIGVGKGPG